MKRSIFWNEVARKTRENKVMSVVRLIQRCINCSADTNTTIVYTFRRGNRWCLFPFLAFVPQEQRLKCLVSWLALPQETPRVRDQQCLSRPKFSPISPCLYPRLARISNNSDILKNEKEENQKKDNLLYSLIQKLRRVRKK